MAGSCLIGPRSPAGGLSQCTPWASQAKLLEASSGILPLAGSCADAGAANARHAAPAPSAAATMPRNSALDRDRWGLSLAARFNIGMLLAQRGLNRTAFAARNRKLHQFPAPMEGG